MTPATVKKWEKHTPEEKLPARARAKPEEGEKKRDNEKAHEGGLVHTPQHRLEYGELVH